MDWDIKLAWRGSVTSVQPRIRLFRSFDERSHSYLGYVVFLDGEVGGDEQPFSVALGKAAYLKHRVQVGDELVGEAVPVASPELETADFYKASKLKVRQLQTENPAPPPWHGVAPDLPTYRSRGHRRLDARTYDAKCGSCIWGCRMPVEIIIDKWDQSRKQHRQETFCYGPISCPSYRAGAARKVKGRKGMTYIEEDWVDQDAVSHRTPDE